MGTNGIAESDHNECTSFVGLQFHNAVVEMLIIYMMVGDFA